MDPDPRAPKTYGSRLFGKEVPCMLLFRYVPDMSEDVLREASLEKEVFDLHPGHEPVLVVVRLSKQCLVSTNRRKESLDRKIVYFLNTAYTYLHLL